MNRQTRWGVTMQEVAPYTRNVFITMKITRLCEGWSCKRLHQRPEGKVSKHDGKQYISGDKTILYSNDKIKLHLFLPRGPFLVHKAPDAPGLDWKYTIFQWKIILKMQKMQHLHVCLREEINDVLKIKTLRVLRFHIRILLLFMEFYLK